MNNDVKVFKSDVDYIREYSDLTDFQIRVKILTGEYKDIILEFGGSSIIQCSAFTDTKMVYDYTLYYKPERFQNVNLRGDKDFENHLYELLINILRDIKKDKDNLEKLRDAVDNPYYKGKITIDKRFY